MQVSSRIRVHRKPTVKSSTKSEKFYYPEKEVRPIWILEELSNTLLMCRLAEMEFWNKVLREVFGILMGKSFQRVLFDEKGKVDTLSLVLTDCNALHTVKRKVNSDQCHSRQSPRLLPGNENSEHFFL